MKILSWILLTVGLLLVTILTTSTIEYFFPDSINWIMAEVDWWYAKIWGWALFTVFALTATILVGWIIFKVAPLLVPLLRRSWPFIVAGAQKATSNPTGQKVLLVIGGLVILSILLVVAIVGIWILSLIW